MGTARMAVPQHIFDQNLLFGNILFRPTNCQLKSIELWPQESLILTAITGTSAVVCTFVITHAGYLLCF